MKTLLLAIPILIASIVASAQKANKYAKEDSALYIWSTKTLSPDGDNRAMPESARFKVWRDSLTKVCKARGIAKWVYIREEDESIFLFQRSDTVEQEESRRERKKRRKHEQ